MDAVTLLLLDRFQNHFSLLGKSHSPILQV